MIVVFPIQISVIASALNEFGGGENLMGRGSYAQELNSN